MTGVVPVAAGDLNGNGKPDLITNTSNAGIVEILLNNGNGTFTAGQNLQTASGPSVSGQPVALSDLNGDQKLDLVAANTGTELNAATLPDIVSVLYGNGDGTFANFPSYPATPAATHPAQSAHRLRETLMATANRTWPYPYSPSDGITTWRFRSYSMIAKVLRRRLLPNYQVPSARCLRFI